MFFSQSTNAKQGLPFSLLFELLCGCGLLTRIHSKGSLCVGSSFDPLFPPFCVRKKGVDEVFVYTNGQFNRFNISCMYYKTSTNAVFQGSHSFQGFQCSFYFPCFDAGTVHLLFFAFTNFLRTVFVPINVFHYCILVISRFFVRFPYPYI